MLKLCVQVHIIYGTCYDVVPRTQNQRIRREQTLALYLGSPFDFVLLCEIHHEMSCTLGQCGCVYGDDSFHHGIILECSSLI